MIEFIDDKTRKTPEFFAQHKITGERLAVEAKSRHRPGALGQPRRSLTEGEPLRADVDRLIREALEQNPETSPFLIFVDLNLPFSPVRPAPWVAEITRFLHGEYRERPAELALLNGVIATNYSWHYEGMRPSSDPESAVYPNGQARHVLSAEFWAHITRALGEYGSIPDEEIRKKDMNERYPDLPPL